MTADTRTNVADGTRIGRLGIANLVGPFAALAGLEAGYALTDRACPTGEMGPVHLAFLLSLAVALAAAGVGFGEWRRWGTGGDTEHGGQEARSRFLAMVGCMASAVSAVVIAAQWAATLFLHPCR